MQRKIAERTTTYLTVSKDADVWSWRLSVLIFDEVSKFTPGKEFDDVIEPSKKKCKVNINQYHGFRFSVFVL